MQQGRAEKTVAIGPLDDDRDPAKQWWGPLWRGRITRALVALVGVAIVFSERR